MAVCLDEKDGTYRKHEFPLQGCSSIHLMKSQEDTASHSYCLDVFPVLLEEASVPDTFGCTCDVSQGQDFYTVSGAADKGNISPDSSSQLAFLSILQVPYSSKSQMTSDVHQNCSALIDLQIESSDKFPSCNIDVELSNGCLETAKINEENSTNLMIGEGTLHNAFSMKSGLQLGGKLMQFFTHHGATLLSTSREKCNNERGHNINGNKLRKYKRSASFNSRRIVIFSSILSSMGTMVLIYLTLRVKQISDGLVHA